MIHQWHNANKTAVSGMVINIVQDGGITGPVEMDIVYDCRISTV